MDDLTLFYDGSINYALISSLLCVVLYIIWIISIIIEISKTNYDESVTTKSLKVGDIYICIVLSLLVLVYLFGFIIPICHEYRQDYYHFDIETYNKRWSVIVLFSLPLVYKIFRCILEYASKIWNSIVAYKSWKQQEWYIKVGENTDGTPIYERSLEQPSSDLLEEAKETNGVIAEMNAIIKELREKMKSQTKGSPEYNETKSRLDEASEYKKELRNSLPVVFSKSEIPKQKKISDNESTKPYRNMKNFMYYSVSISAIVLAICAIYCSWCYYNYSKNLNVSLSGKIGYKVEYKISGKLPASEVSDYIQKQSQELINLQDKNR